MMSSNARPVAGWKVVGASTRGAAHVAASVPNQDAIGWQCEGDDICILAVSDGHGSPKCFRSHIGASLAVAAALHRLESFAYAAKGRDVHLSGNARESFARELTEEWSRRVAQHLFDHPFTADELRTQPFASATLDPLLVYGTTLVTVLLTSAFALYAQIGDGAILCINELGSTRRIFTKDPSLDINETESLSQPEAWRFLQLELAPLSGSVPAIIALTTDGYVNSFATEADFLQVGPDLREMLVTQGVDGLARVLPAIVHDASRSGSGDDVTLGIITRIDDRQETNRSDERISA